MGPMEMTLKVWLGVAVAVTMGVVLQARLRKKEDIASRLALGLVPLLLLALGVILLSGILSVLAYDWQPNRLAAAFALVKGYQLYYGPEAGPILNTLYGPVSALVYLPATLANTPTPAILAGSFINAMLFFLPLPWLFLRARRAGSEMTATWAWAGGLACAFAILNSTFSIFAIHADAPAQCFALLACIPLMYRREEERSVDFALASVFLALAAWSKQTAAPLALALPLYVWWADGWKTCRDFLRIYVPIGLALSALFLVAFGPREALFNMFTIPAKHPWDPPGLKGLVSGTAELIGAAWVYLFALAALLYFDRQSSGAKDWGGRAWAKDRPWLVLLLGAVCLVPLGVVSRVKVGGLANSFYSNYLLIAGVVLAWTILAARAARPTSWIAYALLLGVTTHGIVAQRELRGLALLPNPRQNMHEAAYLLAKNFPRQLYFPWQVLSSLLADGELYHFAYGVFDRELGGYAPTDAHFRAHMPKNMQAIGYFAGYPDHTSMRKYLPEFTRAAQIQDVPGLVLLSRQPAPPPPAPPKPGKSKRK